MLFRQKPTGKFYCNNPATMCPNCRKKCSQLSGQIPRVDLLHRLGYFPVKFYGCFIGPVKESYAKDLAEALKQRLSSQYLKPVRVYVYLTPVRSVPFGRISDAVDARILVDFPTVINIDRQLVRTTFRHFAGNWTVAEIVEDGDFSAYRLSWFEAMVQSKRLKLKS
ncbi:hypothetical protein BJX99DRAFT_219501 [Aspergillus californicus]